MRSPALVPRLEVALAVAATIAAILAACSEHVAPRFPHKTHLAGLACGHPGEPECLRCSGCHTPSGKDRIHKLPDAALCDRCHASDQRETRQILARVPERPDGEITFDHDRHLALAGIQGQCVPCHAGVVEKNTPDIPPMKQCFGCHEHEAQWNRRECTPCHARADLAHLLPRTFSRHEGDFVRNHGRAAATDGALCRSCHAPADCESCHDVTQAMTVEARRPEAVERNFVHRGDFITRHPMEAQVDSARCLSCHEPASCDACHVERGVSGNAVSGRSPHPIGWMGRDPSAPDFHGRAARRDVALCASCHEQGPATNCIQCHKVGAYGGNPHPPGYHTSQSEHEGMCRYCHD